MMAQRQLVRLYDKLMFSGKNRRYWGNSDFYNFGYWGAGIASQDEASIALVDRLIDRIGNRPGRILDVACGMGASTKRLMRSWPARSIIAINISDNQIAKAKENAPGCAILKMDATDLDFPDGHFEAVLCVEAAFHFDTRDAFLREAWRVLKPGGRLVLSDILFRPLVWLATAPGVPKANQIASIEEYRGRLQTAGFSAIEIEDETDACLGAFRRNLSQWPDVADNGADARFGEKLTLFLGCRTLSAYLGLTSKTYLLVTATKPAA